MPRPIRVTGMIRAARGAPRPHLFSNVYVEAMRVLQIHASPFAKRLARTDARGVTFVRPELVAEVVFRGWSSDGLVRHASFRSLREDKLPSDVTGEG